MGIQSTVKISREIAIKRIIKINALILDKDYKEIESESFEESDIDYLVNEAKPIMDSEEDLGKWTNKMLEKKMDEPLYRNSFFDNYWVVEDEKNS